MKIGILGAGSWGSALANLLAYNGHEVTIWSIDQKEIEMLREFHEQKDRLPGVILNTSIAYTTDLETAVTDKEMIVCAVPSPFVRGTAAKIAPYIKEGQLIVNVSKGIEEATLKALVEVIEEEIPVANVAVLSGPSHAEEVGRFIPTTVVAGARNIETAKIIQNAFMNERFRVYTSTDVTGIELGGSIKNVIALAAGMSDGLGCGDNTKAALMTRGMAEIMRLGLAMGARVETLSGLSGMGDLIVTCTSRHSRNRNAGYLIGQGKTYEEAVGSRWAMTTPMPESVKKMVVLDASKVEEVASQVDFIFCAVNMPKAEIKALEEAYAKAECPVVSNNSANRGTPDVPMVVPEINADHIEIIPAQRKRLGTKRGFIAVKSNCSLQSYVPALHPLMKDFGVSKALVCTYQAISGAGKTFDRMPEIVDNVIPYIGGEEEKSEQEPLKLWGHIEGDRIVNAEKPVITAQCFRVPVSDGHTAAVFVSFDKKPTKEQILAAWANFRGPAQELELPSAPKQFLHYFTENDRPQPKLDRNTEHGMAVCLGRLREDTLFDYKFACMSHNTLRGAAGGAVLLAELLAAKGYFD